MKNFSRIFLTIIFTVYLALLVSVLFLQYGRQFDPSFLSVSERLESSANLVPFQTVKNYFKALELGNISLQPVFLNIVGNAVLFLPMGSLLPALTKRHGFFRILILILLMIAAVECIQLITGLGRFDVDDMILNFAGAVIGYIIYAILKKAAKQKKHG